MNARRFDDVPLHRLLGIRADRQGAGFVQYRLVPVDGAAAVASFAITTAVDIAIVDAVGTTIDHRAVTMNGTAELNLTYVDRPPAGEAIVHATVLHRGERVAAVEARVTDGRGEGIAFGRGTYSLRPGGGRA